MKKLIVMVMGLATGVAGAVELLPSGGDDAPTVQAALDASDGALKSPLARWMTRASATTTRQAAERASFSAEPLPLFAAVVFSAT